MPKKIIARVHTAVVVNGDRIVIEPGQEIPDVSDHDATQLIASGAAVDPAAEAVAAREHKRDEAAANAEFAAEREAVLAARESTSEAEVGKTELDGKEPAGGNTKKKA